MKSAVADVKDDHVLRRLVPGAPARSTGVCNADDTGRREAMSSMDKVNQTGRVALEDVAEAVTKGVLRALESSGGTETGGGQVTELAPAGIGAGSPIFRNPAIWFGGLLYDAVKLGTIPQINGGINIGGHQ